MILGNIASGLNRRAPEVDRAVSALVEDIYQRGLDQKILFVLSGQFGRTPRINNRAGRDHWGQLSTLALSGGGLSVGQTVGESSAKAEDPGGRPVPMLESGTPIAELLAG